MTNPLSRRSLVATLPLLAMASQAQAQGAAHAGVIAAAPRGHWAPERPVRIIIPVAPGGSLDILGRTVARALSPVLGQPVVAENHAGAGSNIAFEMTARARPDGLTLLVGSDPLTINPGLYPRLGYDPVRDFAPIIEMVRAPQVLVVNPASPVRDLAGFIAAARGAEGAMTLASQGNGSIGHLAGALFARERGLSFTHVPYRGGGPAVLDVVAGHVDSLFVTLPAAIEHIRGGRLRALAVTSAAPSPALPGVPSIENFDVVTWQGLVAPAGTPAPIIARIAEETGRVLQDPAIRGNFSNQGFLVTGTGPDAFAAHIRTEAERWPALVRAVGARVE